MEHDIEYDIMISDVGSKNSAPFLIEYGDCTEDDAIVHAKSKLEEIWNREKLNGAVSYEWNARDKCGSVKYFDEGELRVGIIKVISTPVIEVGNKTVAEKD